MEQSHQLGLASYESLLHVELGDITKEDLKKPNNTYAFSIPPEGAIYISGNSHEALARKYNFSLDHTLTEGYLEIGKGGEIHINFKHDIYQPVPGFKGTREELQVLKELIKEKILDYMISL